MSIISSATRWAPMRPRGTSSRPPLYTLTGLARRPGLGEGGKRSACATSALMHAVHGQRPTHVPAGTLECANLPCGRAPADRRPVMERIVPHRESPRPEPHPVPLVVPPEAAFEAADGLGFILTYVEGSRRGRTSPTVLGAGHFPSTTGCAARPIRILRALRQSPVLLVSCRRATMPGAAVAIRTLAEWVAATGLATPQGSIRARRMACELPGNQFPVCRPPRRVQAWERGSPPASNANPARDHRPIYRDYVAGPSRPVVSHEIVASGACTRNLRPRSRSTNRYPRRRTSEILADRCGAHHLESRPRTS